MLRGETQMEAEAREAKEFDRATWQLKVLGGRASGALLPLPPGKYSLGQDEDSDFIFLDDAFLGGKVILEIGAVSAAPMLRTTGLVKAQVGGKLLSTEAVELGAYQAIDVGGTRFALGPAGEPWPEPKVADNEASVDDGLKAAEAAAQEAQARKAAALAAAQSRRQRRNRRLLRTGVALFILAGIAGIGWTLFHERPDARAAVKAIIADLSLPDVKLVEAAGALWVKGFVRTEAERSALLARLGGVEPKVQARIISAEETRASILDVLALYQMDFDVDIGPGGKAVIAGVSDKPAMVQEILESVRQGVQSETEVEGRILPPGNVLPWLNQMLAAKALPHKVRLEASRGRLVGNLVKNQLDSLELDAWRTIKASFQSQFGLAIEDRWTDKLSPALLRFAAAAQELENDMRGVTVGELSYVTMRDGRKYFEGARLKSGPYIKSIGKDRIVMTIGNLEQNYFVKRGTR